MTESIAALRELVQSLCSEDVLTVIGSEAAIGALYRTAGPVDRFDQAGTRYVSVEHTLLNPERVYILDGPGLAEMEKLIGEVD